MMDAAAHDHNDVVGSAADIEMVILFIMLPEAMILIIIMMLNTFFLVKEGSWRGLSGSAGMLPGPAPDLGSPLCGVPL